MNDSGLVFYAEAQAKNLHDRVPDAKTWHAAIDMALDQQLREHAGKILASKLFEADGIATYGKAITRIRAFLKAAVKDFKLKGGRGASAEERWIGVAAALAPEPEWSKTIKPLLDEAADAALNAAFDVKPRSKNLQELCGDGIQDAVATAQELHKLRRVIAQAAQEAATARVVLQRKRAA